jgi:hypothetical protein
MSGDLQGFSTRIVTDHLFIRSRTVEPPRGVITFFDYLAHNGDDPPEFNARNEAFTRVITWKALV